MVSEATSQTEAGSGDAGRGGQKRDRSSIAFPYADLAQAVELVRTADTRAGGQCEVTQLAAWMGMSSKGGTFRSRYSAARIFGLIEPNQGSRVRITSLGQQVLNAQEAPRAMAQAFLHVPLFRKIYDQQKGRPLPPPTALERMSEDLGVAPKQVERARQTFIKSAQAARFIDQRTGNFVEPGFPEVGKPNSVNHDNSVNSSSQMYDDNSCDDEPYFEIDPIINGLIRRLPASGGVWPPAERKLWLEILENTFRLVYDDGEAEGEKMTE